MTLLGQVSLWLSLLTAVWGGVVGSFALRTNARALHQSAARAPGVLAGLLAVTVLSLATGLIRFDPRMAFVIENANRMLPDGYRALAVIASPEGGVLAALLIAALATAGLQWNAALDARARAAIGLPLLLLAAGLIAIVLARAPFALLDAVPADGMGLDPALRHPLMAIGPPFVLVGAGLGFAGWAARLGSASSGTEAQGARLAIRFAALAMTMGLMASAWWSYGTARWGVGWVPVDGAVAPWVALMVCASLSPGRAHVELPLTAFAALAILVGLFVLPDDAAPRASAFGASATGAAVLIVAALPLALPFALSRITGRLATGLPGTALRESRFGTQVAAAGGALWLVAALAVVVGGRGRAIELSPGDSATIETAVGGAYTIRQLDVSSFSERDHVARIAVARVSRGSGAPQLIASEWRQYVDVTGEALGAAVVHPGTYHGLAADLQLELVDVGPGGTVRYGVRSVPLTIVALIGGVLLLFGSVLLVVPGRWS